MAKLMAYNEELSGSTDNALNIKYGDTNVAEALGNVIAKADSNRAIISDEWTSKGYSKGDYVIYNNTLYVCILDHASGIVPTNATYWKATTVGKEIPQVVCLGQNILVGATQTNLAYTGIKITTGKNCYANVTISTGWNSFPAKEIALSSSESDAGTSTLRAYATYTSGKSNFVNLSHAMRPNTTRYLWISTTSASSAEYIDYNIVASNSNITIERT